MHDYLKQQFGLDGMRAVVTGAGRGIGRDIAEALAYSGAEVLVHYNRSEEAAREVVETITASGAAAWCSGGDLTDSAQVNDLFARVEARWGGLDILVNNAGDLVKRCKIAEYGDELLEQVLKVNLHTAVYSARAAIPLLRKSENASIINLSSVAAHHGGGNGATAYAATKGAIHTYTRGLAKELAPHIRVNGIAPGVAMTDFHRVHSTTENLEKIRSNTLLERLGEPSDHGAAVVFLCGRGASFITGEIIEINGGLWLA